MMNPPPIPPQRARITPWIPWLVILGAVLAVGLTIYGGLAIGRGFQAADHRLGGEDQYPRLMERWSYGHGDVKAVRIPLQGIIMRQSGGGLFTSGIDKVREILHQIRAATHDQDVKAILLEVDSPGGAITPTDEIYHELNRFKESRDDRIVVAFTRDLAASGGYYAAMAADWIIAEPTSIVGSIGVIMQALNWKQLTDDIGIRDITIKSGENKDMLNPFQEPDPAEVALLQEVVDSMYARFRKIVQTSRNLDESAMREIADGRIFSAEEALDVRMIDQIGYWTDAADRVSELTGEEDVRFVEYYRHMDWFTLLTQVKTPTVNPTAWFNQGPRLMYLWRP
jgi:protease IV